MQKEKAIIVLLMAIEKFLNDQNHDQNYAWTLQFNATERPKEWELW